ncbi:heavy metal translocating P-type ATPase [Planococcus salinus]|uniref:Heavy metal translocating P-type ATPase n=1 Tax=Planococcus salinus TaxID=1848460 RepID=A0A3M8P3N1_9BACL|nr:heavy metal translocating P-type ATPase [Planococcus salinus]RNF38303.1 heavy metal translocating P-type ATPase [Planococcus salinus]
MKIWTSHIELIAAIASGILIVIAYILEVQSIEVLSVITYLSAFLIGGYAKAKYGIKKTIENRKPNVELLMVLAAIGASIIGYWTEGAILIFIFSLSGALETYTMNKSSKEVSALMEIQPEEAWLFKNGTTTRVPVSSLQPGDALVVKPGELISADGKLLKGHTVVDESTISGESVPVSKDAADELFASTVNLSGAITMEVTKPNTESLVQKIIDLVQSAQSEKPPSQQFVERFEGHYVNVVLVVFGLLLFLPHYLFNWEWDTTFYRAILFLVVASPCALVASIMPATLAAISNGAKSGIVFKGGVHLGNLGEVSAIAFDKTGTITRGRPIVTDFTLREDVDADKLMGKIAGIESQSNHPLAKAITEFIKEKGIVPLTNLQITDVPGNGLESVIDGEEIKIGKPDFVNLEEAEAFQGGLLNRLANEGKTVTFVRDGKGIAAAISLKDTVRDNAKSTIQDLQKAGIYCIMLTGDNQKTAKAIAEESGMDAYVGSCMPGDKVEELKKLTQRYQYVAMIGDGINDAPALAIATTGIAMGEGTDVALETADIILMKNDLSRISYSIRLARKMQKIIKQNIFFSVGMIIFLLILNFMQAITIPLGVIGHEGSTLLVILNGLRMLNRNI